MSTFQELDARTPLRIYAFSFLADKGIWPMIFTDSVKYEARLFQNWGLPGPVSITCAKRTRFTCKCQSKINLPSNYDDNLSDSAVIKHVLDMSLTCFQDCDVVHIIYMRKHTYLLAFKMHFMAELSV